MTTCGDNLVGSVNGGIVEEFMGVFDTLFTPVPDNMRCVGQRNANSHGNIFSGSIHQKLLHGAIEGNEDVVKQALDLGASLNTVRDDMGMTALHLAAWNGHSKIVQSLLERGASPQTTSKHGSTPVHTACDKGHTEIARMLLSNGGLVNARNHGGMTALHHASYHDFSVTAAMLLDMGADMGIKDNFGRTPLHLASRQGSVAVACMLLENGANPSPTDQEGYTPLSVAADSQTAACLRKKMSITQFKKMTPVPTEGAEQDSTKAIIDKLILEFRQQKVELADQQDKYSHVDTLMELVKKMEQHDQASKANIAAQVRANKALETDHEAERAKVQAVIEQHLQVFNTSLLSPLDKELKMRQSRDLVRQAQIAELKVVAAALDEKDQEFKKKISVFGHLASL